jgi:hypothetical protein
MSISLLSFAAERAADGVGFPWFPWRVFWIPTMTSHNTNDDNVSCHLPVLPTHTFFSLSFFSPAQQSPDFYFFLRFWGVVTTEAREPEIMHGQEKDF